MPATVWTSLASRFTPISSTEKRLAMDSVFEDDTLSPEPGEADQSLALDHASFGLSRTASLSEGLKPPPDGTVPSCLPRLRSAETLRHGNSTNAKYRDDGSRGVRLDGIPHSTASLGLTSSLQSQGLLASPLRRSLTTGQDRAAHQASLTSLSSAWRATSSAGSPRVTSVENHPVPPPNAMSIHPMPLAARELVREALQNIPPGLRTPSRMSRAGKPEAGTVQTTGGREEGDSGRQGHLESVRNVKSRPPENRVSSPRSSSASRDGPTSPQSWAAGLKSHSSNGKSAAQSVSCHLQGSASDGSISSPPVRKKPPPLPAPMPSFGPLEELSPISSGGHERHDGVIWINGHRIDPHEPHGNDARESHSIHD